MWFIWYKTSVPQVKTNIDTDGSITLGGVHKWCTQILANFTPPTPSVTHLCPNPYALLPKSASGRGFDEKVGSHFNKTSLGRIQKKLEAHFGHYSI